MIPKPWEHPDAEQAEAQLRGINRRLTELEKALDACGEILSEEPDSFAASIAADNLKFMQRRLLSERALILQTRRNELLDVVFSGIGFADSSAKLSEIGAFLFRFQRFFESVAQAVITGPTPRGPLSDAVHQKSTLRLASTFDSSFGMRIFIASNYDMFGRSTAVRTLRIVFGFLDRADQSDEVLSFVGEIGPRATSHFRRLARELRSTEASIALKWRDQSGIESVWDADPERINRIYEATRSTIDTETRDREIVGILVGASLLRNTFELLDVETREIIVGHVTQDAWEQLAENFGNAVLSRISIQTTTNRVTSETKTAYIATSFSTIAALPDSSPWKRYLRPPQSE